MAPSKSLKPDGKTLEVKIEEFLDDVYRKYHSSKKNLDKLRFIDRQIRLAELKLKYYPQHEERLKKLLSNITNASWDEVVNEIRSQDCSIQDDIGD